MRILGIDPGTSCGWAIWTEEAGIIAAGTWDLSPRRHEGGGMRFVRLRRHLEELLSSGKLLIAYEEVRRHLGTDAAHIYGGIVATVQSCCEESGRPYMAIPVATVKKVATGAGNAKKEAMVEAATDRWPHVLDQVKDSEKNDAADACWIALSAALELGFIPAGS